MTRFKCRFCGKMTAGRKPVRGDLSARFPRRHDAPDGEICPGVYDLAIWVEEDGKLSRVVLDRKDTEDIR